MSDVNLICADARRIPLADESVQCIVTSPPYWGLRKYAGEQELVWASGTGIPACALDSHEWIMSTVEAEETDSARWANANSGKDLRTGKSTNRFNGDRDAVEKERSWS